MHVSMNAYKSVIIVQIAIPVYALLLIAKTCKNYW